MSENRLVPVPSTNRNLDHPLHDWVQSSAPNKAQASEPTNLKDYLAVVLKYKWLILTSVVIITTLVAIKMYLTPSIYEAATTIQIEQKTHSVLQAKDIVINAAQDPNYWNTQLKLLENPQLARQVILSLDLVSDPNFTGSSSSGGGLVSKMRSAIKGKSESGQKSATVPTVSDSSFPDAENLSAEELKKIEPYENALLGGLIVDPIEGTNLVTVKYRHTNPELAMNIANKIAEVFIINDIKKETAGSHRSTEMLAKQIAELQQKIKEGEEARVTFLKSHNLPLTEAKGQNITAERLETLSAHLLSAENDRKNLQAIYESASRQNNALAIPEVQEDKAIQALKEKMNELEEKRSALLVQYTPEWPEVRKIDEQIKSVKLSSERVARDVVSSIRSKYEAALARESKLRAAYYDERSKANKQSQDDLSLGNLRQELETNKQLYNTLFQRQKELEIASNDRSNQVRVSTPARLPQAPVGPKRLRNILIAFLVSLLFGVGIAFFLDYLDDTLKSIEDVDRHLHLATLALIPAPKTERFLKNRQNPAESNDNTALALIDDVRSPISEAYRHLRTSLLLSSAGQPPKTILVTSSQPSEGKTTTAVNTAVMLAQTGADVLIIDCDLRRPRIHSHFNLANTRGVTNFLSGENNNLDTLYTAYDKVPNLKVMTSGPVPPSPAELLGSEQMRRVLDDATQRFTHVIIDSPPAISFTDASILSTMVEGVMLVVHGGRTSRAVVRRAKQILVDVGAHIFGVVLNNVKIESQSYYYYHGYYSSYYYRPGDEEEVLPDSSVKST